MLMRIVKLTLLALTVSAESQEHDSTNANSSLVAADEKQNLDEVDPFVATGLSEEADHVSNESNTMNLSGESEAQTDASLSPDDGSKDDKEEAKLSSENESTNAVEPANLPEEKKPEITTSNDLFGISSDTKDTKKEESKNSGSRFWTELVIDNKSSNVLVNIKTVTIVESMASVAPKTLLKDASTVSSTAKSASPDTFPYIKVQMPSSSMRTSNPKTTVKSKTLSAGKRSTVSKSSSIVSKSLSTVNTSKTISQSKASSSIKTTADVKSASVYKASISSKISPASKVVSTSKKIASSTKVATSSRISSSTATVTTSAVKRDGFSKPNSTEKAQQQKTVPPTVKGEEAASVGSIFNVLKNLPSGDKDNSGLYVEGTFKFPKRKEISDKVFKLTGYVSQG